MEALLAYAKNGYRDQYKDLLDSYQKYDELADAHSEDNMLHQGFICFLKAFHHHSCATSLNRAAKVLIDLAEWVFVLEGKRSQTSIDGLERLFDQIWPHAKYLEPRSHKEVSVSVCAHQY